jgi:hypothetical protein
MNRLHFRMLAVFCMICLFVPLLSACGSDSSGNSSDDSKGTYPVDALFREYYQDLGGKDRFGPAISKKFEEDKIQCQYTVSALMCHNPLETGAERYYLAPLGRSLILSPASAEQTSAVYPDFLPIYKALDKYDAVGATLTGVNYNYEQQRVEQYFSNLGFYHRFDDPHGAVYLLPYGAYACNSECTYKVAEADRIDPQVANIDTPFGTSLERMGGSQTFGRPLTHPYETEGGNLEQVYENAVVYAPANDLSDIHLKPLPKLLGMVTTNPGVKVYGADQNMVFYATSGELGYHVPVIFDQFISLHGGLEISGNPITDPYSDPESGIPRQCFENYCLDYHGEAEAEYKIRMAPLGTRYLSEIQGENEEVMTRYVYSNETVLMQVTEGEAQVGSNEEQLISITILQKEDQSPITNVDTKLTLTIPDGEQESYLSSATGADGKTTVNIPAHPKLKTGDLVSYKVCLNVPSDNPICVYDSYLIWNYE